MNVENDQTEENLKLDKNTKGSKTKLIPPDGGWGWVVCAGSFVISIMLASTTSVFGILFYQLIQDLGITSATTAWIFNVYAFIWHIGAFLAGPLAERFSWRLMAMTGGFMASSSLFISAFATSAGYLFVSYSIIGGFGGGLCTTISIFITPSYFERRRGLATATLVSGVSVGHFVAPLVVRLLLKEEGFFGGTIIYSAILLHTCVAGAVYHPLEWHAKVIHDDCTILNEETIKQEIVNNKRSAAHCKQISNLPNVQSTFYASQSSITASALSISKKCNVKDTNSFKKKTKKDTKCSHIINSFIDFNVEVTKSAIEYLKIMKYFRAVIIAFGMGCFISSYANFLMTVPFILQQKGFTLDQAAWAVSTSAISNFICRIASSTISDHPKFNKKICYMSGALLTAISSIVFPFINSYPYILAIMVVWGSGIGLNMGLYSLVMIQFMGIELFPKVMGVTSLLVGFVFIALGPIVGFIKDVTGDYTISMWILGGITGCTFLLWTLMPLAVKYDAKKDNLSKENKSST